MVFHLIMQIQSTIRAYCFIRVRGRHTYCAKSPIIAYVLNTSNTLRYVTICAISAWHK